MRITNIRPKDGFYIELDADKDICFRRNDGAHLKTICGIGRLDCFDYDVIKPEYKIGDRIKILFGFSGNTALAYVVDENEYSLHVATSRGLHWFSKDTLDYQDMEIVGLWEEVTEPTLEQILDRLLSARDDYNEDEMSLGDFLELKFMVMDDLRAVLGYNKQGEQDD